MYYVHIMMGIGPQLIGGVLLFAVFLYFARSVRIADLRGAGMLLTFPILNGIGLFWTGSGSAAKVAAMLPMIAVNGLLSLGFILTVSAFGYRLNPTRMAWPLLLSAIAIWILVFLFELSIPQAWQWKFVICYAALAIWLAPGLRSEPTKPASASDAPSSLRGVIGAELPAIGWFSIALLLVLFVAALGAQWNERVGQLSALPLLPLIGLFRTSKRPDGRQTLEAFKATVLFGPVIAMFFVVSLQPVAEHAEGFTRLTVFVGWLAAAIAIYAVVWGYGRLESRLNLYGTRTSA